MSATHNIEHEVTNTTDHESKPGAHKFVLKKKEMTSWESLSL